jgi:uncharacterized membrane protein YbhN (UPF0104 family)
MKLERAPAWLRWGASVLVLGLAATLLWRQLRGLSLEALLAAMRALPAGAVALSLLATALSFTCLAGYERLATQWLAPGKVPRRVAWRVGLEAHALANTLGFHAITAVALRLRTYRAHGIDGVTLAKIVATIGGCVVVGVAAILLLALAWWQWLEGRGFVVVVVALGVAGAFALLRVRLRSSSRTPVVAHAGVVLALGIVEMAAAVAAFAVLVPAGALPTGPELVLLFVAAMLLGIVSHAPGGLGVFEATILAAAAPDRRAAVLASLLAYRLVYGLLPCALALLAVGIGWLRGRHRDAGVSSTADSGASAGSAATKAAPAPPGK